jgi:iron complex outermembrane receptor protein
LILLCAAAAAQTPQQPQPIAPVNTTVVVIGNLTPVATDESARNVTVFDPQAHPLASEDPEDYLRTDASVDIQQRGAAGVLNDISIRGASFEQTLVLLNGLRIDDAETSHFNLDVPVPLEALGSIDVLHGEGSTQYGSDAIGGVADFETWHPDADTLRLRLGYGSFGEDQEGILGSFAGKKWSELVSADRDRSEGFTFDRDFRSEDAMTETRFASSAGKSDLLFAGDDREFGANQFYGDYNSWERTKGWFAAFTQQFNQHTQADIAYRRHSDIFVLLRNDPAAYKNQHIDDSYEGDLRDSRQLFRHGTLLTGFEETTDEIHSNSLGVHGRNRAAGYAEYEYRVPARFSLSAGLREEFFGGPESTGFTAVSSPMANATFWLPHSLKLHAAVGHGFRQPTYVDLYYSDPSTIGNPNLKPESAWNYEGGLDWYPNAHTSATLTAFTSRQTDTIDYTRISAVYRWQATNLSALHFNGVEAAFDWRPNLNQSLKLSWTLLQGAQAALNGLQSEYVFNYPVNNGRIAWDWNLSHNIFLQSRLGVLERYQQTPYAVLDISAVRETGRWRPYLRTTNLMNTGYAEITGVQMPGRAFLGGIEFVLSRAK